ncbi:hypothetical protein PR202_gb01494 [Eleusine coracana subsp. coracana]|uniref:Apyrase n=1 Tax=Eleusine coracana subsp. coracana TaxID=191504 RepID=A0AAV5DVS5_ELECO|nr:hypothetical protein PR202_gb01494 [Eleusine coracana subsp. coracana]
MATETCLPQAPAMPAVAVRAATAGNGNGKVSVGTLPPPPRRGQIKVKIVKDVVNFVAAMAAGLVKNGRDGGSVQVPADASANTNDKYTRFPRGPLLLALPEARQAHERLLRRPVDKSGLASESATAPSHSPSTPDASAVAHAGRSAAQQGTPGRAPSPAPTSPLRRLHLTGAAARQVGSLSTFICVCPPPPPAIAAGRPPRRMLPVVDMWACGKVGTGTRVYVYEWHINHNDANALPIVLKPLGNAPKKNRDRVKIISGMEEAYYGWIALNHHMNMLGTSSPKMTYGSLDLGGSSLQVTFETGKSVQDETSIGLTIGSVSHQLSAYSLTGYGLNDAFDKSVAHLVKRLGPAANNGKVQVKHPCLQTGYKKDYVCSYCHPVKQDGSPSVGEKTSVNGKLGTAVELVGAPQWNECSALAKVAVNLSEWSSASPGLDCDLHPCALASNFPRPHGQFYAISGFFVVFKFFNLTADATLIDVLKRGQQFCEKPWKVAKSSVPPQPFIEQYCFRAPYIASLLREGLQIKDNQNTGGCSMLGMGSPLRFQLWSSINTGERTKTPLSPTVAGSDPHPFSITHGLGGSSVQLMESSRQSLGAYHSYSVGSLGQMQFSSGVRNPSRGQTTLQSRRSQSREDLISTLADVHVPKV